MEHAQRDTPKACVHLIAAVLILILMEHAQRVTLLNSFKIMETKS